MNAKQFNSITKWQDKTFPEATADSKMKHLKEELEEVQDAYNKKFTDFDYHEMTLEFADCFLLLYGCAAKCGMDYEEICDAIDEKMRINKSRKWGKPDENGVVKHIKEPTN